MKYFVWHNTSTIISKHEQVSLLDEQGRIAPTTQLGKDNK
jgi:hypothetical protein